MLITHTHTHPCCDTMLITRPHTNTHLRARQISILDSSSLHPPPPPSPSGSLVSHSEVLCGMTGGGNGRQGSKGGAVSTSIVDRLRRRLRSNGYRAHLTLQMVPTKGEEHLLSRVHLTPVRASRSLALRFLANKFGLPMQNVTVCCPDIPSCHSNPPVPYLQALESFSEPPAP